MERQMGEKFSMEGQWFQVVPGDDCDICEMDGIASCETLLGLCGENERTDRRSVVAKKTDPPEGQRVELERLVGECFDYNGEWYKMVVGGCTQCDCDNCAFEDNPDCTVIVGRCGAGGRKDGKEVYAVRVRGVSECDHGLEMAEDYVERARRDVREREKTTAPKNNVQEGKARMSLLPMDLLKKYLVPAYEEGIVKYDRESWRGGFNTSIMVDAMLRHIEEFYWQGQDTDPDSTTGKHHLAAVIFCALSILHTQETRPELDDRGWK